MGQNVKEIEMRAAEVPGGGGLSGECKGHYQRAKHVLGFGFFFFFLLVGWLFDFCESSECWPQREIHL